MPVWAQVLAGAVGFIAAVWGIVYLAQRLTAQAAKRMHDGITRGYYAGMAARGKGIALPRAWTSEGLTGHIERTRAQLQHAIRMAFLLTAVTFVVLSILRASPVPGWQLVAEGGLLVAVFASLYVFLFFYERRRVADLLERAGPHAPRSAFKIVANAHGLFVPIDGRVLEGAWQDWAVRQVDVVSGKGGTHCHSLTVALKAEPHVQVPVIASTFEDGDRLLEVIAARADAAFEA